MQDHCTWLFIISLFFLLISVRPSCTFWYIWYCHEGDNIAMPLIERPTCTKYWRLDVMTTKNNSFHLSLCRRQRDSFSISVTFPPSKATNIFVSFSSLQMVRFQNFVFSISSCFYRESKSNTGKKLFKLSIIKHFGLWNPRLPLISKFSRIAINWIYWERWFRQFIWIM